MSIDGLMGGLHGTVVGQKMNLEMMVMDVFSWMRKACGMTGCVMLNTLISANKQTVSSILLIFNGS